MPDFIVQYWAEFLFGILAAFLLAKMNKLSKLEQDNIKRQKTDFRKEIVDSFTEADSDIKKDIQALTLKMEALGKGILSMQGDKFKRQCEKLLDEDHTITVKEYEQCINDHDAYNGLGGNHEGDLLFDSVVKKFEESHK